MTNHNLASDGEAAARIARARTALLLDFPWFGSLALKLAPVAVVGLGTMGTDGTSLAYDPAEIMTWTDAELVAVIAHEVMHCALLHPYRCGERDMGDWNIACDMAINPLLRRAGLRLPDWALDGSEYPDMSAEAIYGRIRAAKVENPTGGDPGVGGTGGGHRQPDFTRAPAPPARAPAPNAPTAAPTAAPGSDSATGGTDTSGRGDAASGAADGPMGGAGAPGAPPTLTADDWQIAVAQVDGVSRKLGGGHGSADIDRAVASTRESAEDCYAALKRFCENVCAGDYSWVRPNRRMVGDGIYLPGITRENTARIGVCVDTSGSIGARLLSRFGGYLGDILAEVRPRELEVVYCDTRVRGDSQRFTPDGDPVELAARGGGGTRFQPALDWFTRDLGDAGDGEETVRAIVYLTDLENGGEVLTAPVDPLSGDEIPVLWVTPAEYSHVGDFGETIRMNPGDGMTGGGY